MSGGQASLCLPGCAGLRAGEAGGGGRRGGGDGQPARNTPARLGLSPV